MSLFLSTSNLHFHQLDCSNPNISDTIERECLSVLHKLHDQVNGLQLVHVVVQPLARLFNPASLADLAANLSPSPSSKQTSSTISSNVPSLYQHDNVNSASGTQSNVSTPSTHFPPSLIGNHQTDSDGTSNASHGNQHSRSQSFASPFGGAGSSSGVGSTIGNQGNNSLISTTSTYMMSPDTAQALIARLDSDRDVNWLMEIIGYGLSMPFSVKGEQDSVKDCCTIYCEWLAAALLPFNEQNEDSKYQQLNKLVPVPIRKEPNKYARKMLSHLYNVFLPRQPIISTPATVNTKSSSVKDESDAILAAVSRQAVLCHRVLRTIESIAHNRTNLMDDETWHHLLAMLLTVNDKLLSPPTELDDIGTQLHDRILGVLFDLMLFACSRSIPDATMWRTFHEMCLNWRHRPALVEHWRRITSLLTKRIVSAPSANQAPKGLNISHSSSSSLILSPIECSIVDMSYENLSHTWHRFLNLIGNPVELSDPSLISRTDEFYHAACSANSVLDPRQHPCLNVLPQMFLNSMLGLRDYVESFLGTYQPQQQREFTTSLLSSRRGSSQANTEHGGGQKQEQLTQSLQFKLNPDRPKCNSILHIFGDWLFSAALIGSELNLELESTASAAGAEFNQTDADCSNISGSITSAASSMTATETDAPPSQSYSPAFRRKQSHQSTTSSHASTSTSGRRRQSKQLESAGLSEQITLDPPLTAESFEPGQAEAMALLCKIFSSKSTLEDVSPAYLARFYLCLQHCLNFGCGLDPKQSVNQVSPIKRQLLASVLMSATLLLQKDLDGINLLIPSLITAIEFVLECDEKKGGPVQAPPRQQGSKQGSSSSLRYGSNMNQQLRNVTNFDLRRACILTLINLIAYPAHFRDLAIRNCLDGTLPTTTFGSLRPRLMKMLFVALQTEIDPTNMQILLGGLSLAIQDLRSSSSSGKQTVRGARQKISTCSSESPQSSLEPSHEQSDNVSQSSFVFNSNDGFLIKSLHVTCHLLINIWKHDNLVSLVALEVLTTIARVSTLMSDATDDQASKRTNNNNVIEMRGEYMQTTKWICDYICNQCSRPPPAHSRDMHSTIVAAYQCLSVWFYNHPYLLDDSVCMNTLMEVIELGVSGQKSRSMSVNPSVGVATPSIISKGEKSMKPSSMRVREAAESLLNTCLTRTSRLDGPRDIAYCDTTLTELDLLDSFGSTSPSSMRMSDIESRHIEAHRAFQYFSDEDSIVFGLFEGGAGAGGGSSQPIGGPSAKDFVICLLRTPFGKHCWRFNFRYCSERAREKMIANKTIGLMKRPFHQSSAAFSHEASTIAFAPLTKSGKSSSFYFNTNAKFFPDTLEDLPTSDLDKMMTSLDDYMRRQADSRVKVDLDKMNKIFSHQVLAEQKVVSEFIAVRRNAKRQDCEEPTQAHETSSGSEAIRVLMQHLGLKNRLEIVKSHTQSAPSVGSRVSQSFIDGLRALDGQSVRTSDCVSVYYVRRGRISHGDILDSVREKQHIQMDFFEWLFELGQPVTGQTSPMGADCLRLLWGDMCQELIFQLPVRTTIAKPCSVMICWLECYEDLASVPIYQLCEPAITTSGNSGPSQDVVRYYVCPMKNGLFRVTLSVPFASPLVDGMTLNKSTLSSLIRESILNLCRRRRLDADSYQPPHVRRRILLQDLCNNHKTTAGILCTGRNKNMIATSSTADMIDTPIVAYIHVLLSDIGRGGQVGVGGGGVDGGGGGGGGGGICGIGKG